MAYTTRASLETMFGAANLIEWADLDNDGSDATILTRINAAIAYADSEIDSRLLNSMYSLPIANKAGDTPAVIEDVSNRLAAVWLYETRGVMELDTETGKPIHKLHWHKVDAEKKLNEILSSVRHLDVDIVSAAPVPKAISS